MAGNFDILAERVFSILKGTGHTLKLYDDEGNKTIDPANARHFYAIEDKFMATLHEDDGNKHELTLLIPENNDDTELKHFGDMIRSLRLSAQNYGVMFTVKKFGHEIRPKDLIHKIKESRSDIMEILEHMNPKMTGTSRTSHQKWNEARLIVKHSKVVNEEQRGARSRNISRIFVETAEGERFLFPTKHLQAARAWCRHLGAGGITNDIVSEHIKDLSNEMETLKEFSSHIGRNRKTLDESAMDVRSSVRGRINEIRTELKRFMTKKAYFETVENIENQEDTLVEASEDLSERIEWLADTLAIAEDHDLFTSLSNLVEFAAPSMVTEEVPVEGGFTEQDVANAYEFRGENNIARDTEGSFDWEGINKDIEPGDDEFMQPPSRERLYFLEAAALLNSNDFTFFDRYEDDEAHKPEDLSPRGKLGWRLAAIAKRLDPTVKGQLVLSNILSYVAERMHEGAAPNKDAQRIAGHFITNIAPEIHESLNIRLQKIEEGMEEVEEDVDVEIVEEPEIDKMNFVESHEMDSWFETFDPDTIIRASAKKKSEVEEDTVHNNSRGQGAKYKAPVAGVIPGNQGKDFKNDIKKGNPVSDELEQYNDEIDTEMYEDGSEFMKDDHVRHKEWGSYGVVVGDPEDGEYPVQFSEDPDIYYVDASTLEMVN